MSDATDELCRLLDERGVEWSASGLSTTRWRVGDTLFRFDEWGGKPRLLMVGITPAQAVEATLGRGTCYDLGDSTRFVCSECGCSLDLSDLDGEPTMWVRDMADTPNYCPSCRREVVEG